MTSPHPDDDLTRFLVRAVLDPEFCALVRHAPDEAFAAYELTEEQRETLRSGDEGVLRLLGSALRGGAEPVGSPAATDAPEAPAPEAPVPEAPVALAPVTLLLTVQPYALSTPEGIRLSFTSSVSAAPAGTAPASPTADAAGPVPPPPSAWSPWDHDLDSERTRDAAAAVRDAPPEERRARILALLAAMTSRERLGGDGVADAG